MHDLVQIATVTRHVPRPDWLKVRLPGGDNYNESRGVVAHNEVHHSTQYPSSITLSVVKK